MSLGRKLTPNVMRDFNALCKSDFNDVNRSECCNAWHVYHTL